MYIVKKQNLNYKINGETLMKKSIIDKIIITLLVIATTIEVGVTIGYYMLVNMDFDKYNSTQDISVVKQSKEVVV